jgi:hypothetical protein
MRKMVNFDEMTYQQIKDQAKKEGLTITFLVNLALIQLLERRKLEKKITR